MHNAAFLLLLQPRLDHNLRDSEGNTPLMVAAYHQKQQVIQFLLQSAVFVENHKRFRRDSKCKSYDLYQADSGTSSAKTNSCCGNNVSGCQAGLTGCHGHPDVSALQAADSCVGGDSSWPLCCQTCTLNCSSLCGGGGGTSRLASKRPSSENLTKHLESPLRETTPPFPHETILETEEFHVEPTTAEVERYDELLTMLQLPDCDLLQPNGALPAEDDPEKTLQDNISCLFDSIKTVSRRGSIFITEIMVSHLCAVNSRDGTTVFHRLIEGGDSVTILDMLLKCDQSGINIQDLQGLSPLHVACLMKRKKTVEKLTVSLHLFANWLVILLHLASKVLHKIT